MKNIVKKSFIASSLIIAGFISVGHTEDSLKSMENSFESSTDSLKEEVVFRPCVGQCQQRLVVAQEIASDILAGYQVSIADHETFTQMVEELNSLNDTEHQLSSDTALETIASYR